ncbi:hypothetical protein STENM36S_08487 [Streptomyces tendae]
MTDQRAEGRAEGALRCRDDLRHGDRRGSRVLGDQLADDHQEHRGEHHAEHQCHRARGRAGQADRFERTGEQLGDRRLGDHADDEPGDGDAELGAGQLEGEAADALEGARGTPLTRAAARSSSPRSAVVSENSAATKAPQRRARAGSPRAAGALRSSGHLGSHDRPGPGRAVARRTGEGSPDVQAFNLSSRGAWKHWRGRVGGVAQTGEVLHPAPPLLLRLVPGGPPRHAGPARCAPAPSRPRGARRAGRTARRRR